MIVARWRKPDDTTHSPSDLHLEYQARVDATVRKASLLSAVRHVPRRPAWARVRAWLLARRSQRVQQQPVESIG